MSNSAEKIIVCYHDNCLDGFGAAFAAWYKLVYLEHKSNVSFIPAQYNKHFAEYLTDLDKDTIIYFVDFSLPADQMFDLCKYIKFMVILDHHKTFKQIIDSHEAAMRDTYEINWTYESEKSGAVIAWEYFNPNEDVPDLLLHVQDRDLWKFQIHGTKEICASLYNTKVVERSFESWLDYCNRPQDLAYLYESGKALLAAQEQLIAEHLGKEHVVKFYDTQLAMCNAPTSITSELGNKLAEKHKCVALVWSVIGKEVICSLRSVGPDEASDCTKLAVKFNGGGHHNAAGFKLKSIQQLYNIFYDSDEI